MAEQVFMGFQGVNIDMPKYLLPERMLGGLVNGWLRLGVIGQRAKFVRLITLPSGFQWFGIFARVNLPSGETFLLGYYDGSNWKLARFRIGDSTWTVIGNLPGQPTSWVVYKGWVFICTTGGMVKTNGTNLFNWGINAPTTAPTASAGTSGNLNGQYQWRVTFVRNADGYLVESNPSPASSVLTLSNQRANLTIPTSSDPQVTGRRIYRFGGTQNAWKFVAEIPDNTTTSFTDNTPDSVLVGAPTLSFFNDPPPVATIAVVHRERIFLAGNPSYPTRVYFSTFGSPEYFPPSTPDDPDGGSWFEVGQQDGQPITALVPVGTMLAIFKTRSCWLLRGESQADFILMPFGNIGASHQNAALSVEGFAFIYDGIHLYNFDGSRFVNMTQQRFSQAFRGVSSANVKLRGDIAERVLWIIMPDKVHIYDLSLDNYIGYWSKSGITFYDVAPDDPSLARGAFFLTSAGLLRTDFEAATDYDNTQPVTSVIFPEIRIPAEMLKRCNRCVCEGNFVSGTIQITAGSNTWNITVPQGIVVKSYAPPNMVAQTIAAQANVVGSIDRLVLDIVPLRRVV